MPRDHRKLRLFAIADDLVIEIYRAPAASPDDERFGLRAQIRRAMVSTACNIVEGSARRSTPDYVHFLNVATGSCAEAQYLVDIAFRLQLITANTHQILDNRFEELLRRLQRLVKALEHLP
jgi:four helix bundle protein